VLLAAAVLGLAAFNLTFRLGQEFVTEWDESLYGLSAWEAVSGGSWIGTTFYRTLDYYNTKPPLLVWLIALSFKAFGPSLVSLRVTSAVSAWLSVAVLQYWTRRHFGAFVALAASLILSTMFGFLYVHSGRSAATDAPFTLVTILTAITVAEEASVRRYAGLGGLLAAAFLLRGMGVLLPLTIVAFAWAVCRQARPSFAQTWALAACFLLPVGAWTVARYHVDQWAFLRPLVLYDFVARTVRPIEGHAGGTLYYFDVLQKHHYDWLFAGVVAVLASPGRADLVRRTWRRWRSRDRRAIVLAGWALVTLAVPTMMRTKVPWYLNTFYPVFSVGLALTLCDRVSATFASRFGGWRRLAVLGAIVVAFGVAEGKLVWYSFNRRDLSLSGQSLMLAERERLRGHRLFLEPHARASHFVAEAIVGATVLRAARRGDFFSTTRAGDYILSSQPCDGADVQLLGMTASRFLSLRQNSEGSDTIGHRRCRWPDLDR
jgi:4-amino-4-deoxy-L-arabinose transferase-like glycosyltransferase